METEGNTLSPQSRKWCFTLNNFTDEEYSKVLNYVKNKKYIIGKEIGENGTPHLQGFFYSKSPMAFSVLKKVNSRWHLEKAVGSFDSNVKYCAKDNNFVSNIHCQHLEKYALLNSEFANVIWKEWQNDILEYIKTKPDSRTIYWVFDEEGNKGKSYLVKYLSLTRDVIICDGKKDNIFNQIKTAYDNHQKIELVIVDMPRYSEKFLNYGVLEQIKNGLLYSGKYEGGICVFPYPHIIVMANSEPQEGSWSSDRVMKITL